jgi:hypothetical protein
MTKKITFLALTPSGVAPEPGTSEGGVVFGPSASVAAHLASFADANGNQLADSGLTVASLGTAVASQAGLTELLHQQVVGASTAALGTTSANAAVLPDATGGVYPVTAADGTVGVRIHADDLVLNRRLLIVNEVTNKALKIYPPTGGTINGAAADAAFTTVSGTGATLICTNATTNTWLAYN